MPRMVLVWGATAAVLFYVSFAAHQGRRCSPRTEPRWLYLGTPPCGCSGSQPLC